MLAYADGKDLQIGGQGSNEWVDVTVPVFNWELNSYRIKPETTYRPFKDAKECFEEMQKHEPLGWVKHKQFLCYMCICMVYPKGVCFGSPLQYKYYEIFDKYTFIDGEPFGIKEELS